mmetsp:Transcript_12300/g.16599  ORF Transcript_12300/g.16599 Transcript_12300/m.16599 type:complete len:573 (-) Transcript_12300:40-1758(-)
MSPVLITTSEISLKKKKKKTQDIEEEEKIIKKQKKAQNNDDIIFVEAENDQFRGHFKNENRKAIDSEIKARRLLQQIIAPIGIKRFYDDISERRALHISGRGEKYWNDLMSIEDIFRVLVETEARNGIDVDVCKLKNGKRQNIMPPTDRVTRAWAEKQYAAGSTIRLRCPQQHLDQIHSLCQGLEDEFGADVSANAYLTPGEGEQGFAPHYDDVDVFILQLHGEKRWQVWTPRDEALKLPRYSSDDYTCESIDQLHKYSIPITLHLAPGELLYLPRGFIHQAQTINQESSLHLTISTNRLNSWTDLLETLLNNGLQAASSSHLNLRSSLPRDMFHYMGLQHQENQENEQLIEQRNTVEIKNDEEDNNDDDCDSIAQVAAAAYDAELDRGHQRQIKRRSAFRAQVRRRLHQVIDVCLDDDILDAAADDVALRFLADRQPPPRYKHRVTNISHTTKLRPVSRRAARLVLDDDNHQALLYHALDNGRTHRASPIACLEFQLDDAPAIEILLSAHIARPVAVSDLPHASLDDKLELARTLYDEGLLVAVDDDQVDYINDSNSPDDEKEESEESVAD